MAANGQLRSATGPRQQGPPSPPDVGWRAIRWLEQHGAAARVGRGDYEPALFWRWMGQPVVAVLVFYGLQLNPNEAQLKNFPGTGTAIAGRQMLANANISPGAMKPFIVIDASNQNKGAPVFEAEMANAKIIVNGAAAIGLELDAHIEMVISALQGVPELRRTPV
jgi:hypothetical protein